MSSEPVVPELDRLKRKLRVTQPQSSAGKPRVRRVTRVIRDIDPWSVFKVGLAFHLVLYFVVLISVLL